MVYTIYLDTTEWKSVFRGVQYASYGDCISSWLLLVDKFCLVF